MKLYIAALDRQELIRLYKRLDLQLMLCDLCVVNETMQLNPFSSLTSSSADCGAFYMERKAQ